MKIDQDSQEKLRPEDIARQIYADAGPLGGSHFDDMFDTQTIEEDEPVDLRDEGETPDEYWSKGWVLDFCSIKRSDYDSHNGRYHRVFPTRYRLIDSVPPEASGAFWQIMPISSLSFVRCGSPRQKKI